MEDRRLIVAADGTEAGADVTLLASAIVSDGGTALDAGASRDVRRIAGGRVTTLATELESCESIAFSADTL
jgi:hypothetical protein